MTPATDDPAVAALPRELQALWQHIEVLDARIREAVEEPHPGGLAELAHERHAQVVALAAALDAPGTDPVLRHEVLSRLQATNRQLQQHAGDALGGVMQEMAGTHARRRGIDAYHSQQEAD